MPLQHLGEIVNVQGFDMDSWVQPEVVSNEVRTHASPQLIMLYSRQVLSGDCRPPNLLKCVNIGLQRTWFMHAEFQGFPAASQPSQTSMSTSVKV